MNIERDKWSPEQRRMDRAIREVARAIEHHAKAMADPEARRTAELMRRFTKRKPRRLRVSAEEQMLWAQRVTHVGKEQAADEARVPLWQMEKWIKRFTP